MEYTPPGSSDNNATVNNYKFTGKERDAESGLDYFGARYNASSMGRFMSPDPKSPNSSHLSNPQKWNKYAYTFNNPLSMVDPDGEDPSFVFRPLSTSNGKAWDRAVANAAKHGNEMHVLNGKAATAQAYTDALKTPTAHVVTSGHTVIDNEGSAHSVALSDKQVGTMGESLSPNGGAPYQTPVITPQSSATDVAVFGCTSDGLADQYTSTTFSGTSGPEFLDSLDAGALAYSNVVSGNGTVTQADKAAQDAMAADHNTHSNKDEEKTPRVDKHDKKTQ